MRFSQVQLALLATALLGAPAVFANEADEVTSVNAREATVEVEARQEAPQVEAREETVELEARNFRGVEHIADGIKNVVANHRHRQRELDELVELEARGSGARMGERFEEHIRNAVDAKRNHHRELDEVVDLEARRGGRSGGRRGGHGRHMGGGAMRGAMRGASAAAGAAPATPQERDLDEVNELEARRVDRNIGCRLRNCANRPRPWEQRDLDEVNELEARRGGRGRGAGRAIGGALGHAAGGFANSFAQRDTYMGDRGARRDGRSKPRGRLGGRGAQGKSRMGAGAQKQEARELTEEPEVLQRRIDDFEALLARYAESDAAELD